jgi:hypothetical protein
VVPVRLEPVARQDVGERARLFLRIFQGCGPGGPPEGGARGWEYGGEVVWVRCRVRSRGGCPV